MNVIVVSGMHRSGTSALTGVLTHLGFDPGDQLMPADQHNAKGYFEDLLLNSCLDKLLKALGRSWYDPRPLPDDWLRSDAALLALDELTVLFLKRSVDEKAYILKNPRICRLLPLFQLVFEAQGISAQFLFSLRSPLAVFSSLEKRDSLPRHHAALLYLAYLFDAELATRGHIRIFIDYDDLLVNWRYCLEKISQRFGLKFPVMNSNSVSSEAQIEYFLAPDLNRSSVRDSDFDSYEQEMAAALYHLLKHSDDPARQIRIDELRHKWLSHLLLIDPWLKAGHDFKVSAISYHQKSLSTVYWATAQLGYCDANAVSVEWHFGSQMDQRFFLRTINSPIVGIRFDITDQPASCLIEKVWIEDSDKNPVWSWDCKEALFYQNSCDMHIIGVNNKRLLILASGSDPYGSLRVPPHILSSVNSGWAVCVVWRARSLVEVGW